MVHRARSRPLPPRPKTVRAPYATYGRVTHFRLDAEADQDFIAARDALEAIMGARVTASIVHRRAIQLLARHLRSGEVDVAHEIAAVRSVLR